jgi:hypothetical protein
VSHDGGKTIFIRTFDENGVEKYLKSGNNDAYVRNGTDDYLYLADTFEGAHWIIDGGASSFDPLAFVVDTS